MVNNEGRETKELMTNNEKQKRQDGGEFGLRMKLLTAELAIELPLHDYD